MTAYNMFYFAKYFFQAISCFGDASIHIGVCISCCSFILKNNIPLYEYTIVYPFAYWWTLGVSVFHSYEYSCYEVLCKVLLWTHAFILDKYRGLELLGYKVGTCLLP